MKKTMVYKVNDLSKGHSQLMAPNQAPQGMLYWFYQDTVIHHSPRLLSLPSAVSTSPNSYSNLSYNT